MTSSRDSFLFSDIPVARSPTDELARVTRLNAWQADEIQRLRAALERIGEHALATAPDVASVARAALYGRSALQVEAWSETLCSGHCHGGRYG